jgi:hypothetical protein
MLTPVPLSATVTAQPQALGTDGPLGWALSGNGATAVMALALMAALAGLPLLAATRALSPQPVPPDSWAEALDRKVSALCTAVFGVLGAMCGGLGLAAWVVQCPVTMLGLGVTGVAFLTAALVTARQALRR